MGIFGYYRIYSLLGYIPAFCIHISHNALFDEYYSRLSTEYKHTTGCLILQKYPKSFLNNSDLINLTLCELVITSTLLSDTTILTYIIELPPSINKIKFNILDYEYFSIPYVFDKIPNSQDGHQIP